MPCAWTDYVATAEIGCGDGWAPFDNVRWESDTNLIPPNDPWWTWNAGGYWEAEQSDGACDSCHRDLIPATGQTWDDSFTATTCAFEVTFPEVSAEGDQGIIYISIAHTGNKYSVSELSDPVWLRPAGTYRFVCALVSGGSVSVYQGESLLGTFSSNFAQSASSGVKFGLFFQGSGDAGADMRETRLMAELS